jgi:hypothetical protein
LLTGAINATDGDAYGVKAGDIAANSTTVNAHAYGAYIGTVEGKTNARGFHTSHITCTSGSAIGVHTGDINGTDAYGTIHESLTSTSGVARAISLGIVDASSGTSAAAIFANNVVADTDALCFRANLISGTDAAGFRVEGNITATTGNAHAIEIDGSVQTTGGTGNAIAFQTAGISSFGGTAYALKTGTVSGETEAGGVRTAAVTSSAGLGVGVYINNVTAYTNVWGVYVGNLTSTNAGNAYGFTAVDVESTTGSARGLYVSSVSSTTSGDVDGVHLGAITSASGNARGFQSSAITGTASAIAFNVDGNVIATAGDVAGYRINGTIRSTGGSGDAIGAKLSNVTSDTGSAYAYDAGDVNGAVGAIGSRITSVTTASEFRRHYLYEQ